MYIVFEGIVGSGKSTQSKKLVEYLKNIYPEREVVHVREPGSTPIAEDIRYLCQGKEWEDEQMHPLTNAYLYAAARAQTLHTIVKPALASGKIVVSDRSFLSSVAYQGEAQGLGIDRVLSVNQEAIEGVFPDMVFHMDIDVDTALSRTFDAVGDKWEKMGKSFFESIVTGYKKAAALPHIEPIFHTIDARGCVEDVFNRIIKNFTIKTNSIALLTETIEKYAIYFPNERKYAINIINFLNINQQKAFHNYHWDDGHITASMLIVNTEFTKVLLILHKKLQRWLQFGGHSDDSSDVLTTAVREFHEESGIREEPEIFSYFPVDTLPIFDIDIHDIPHDAKGRPSHKHYDIRFLGIISDTLLFNRQIDETDDLRWFDIEEVGNYLQEDGIIRMIEKIRKLK